LLLDVSGIAGPFIWNFLKRAPDRVVAAVPAQPVGFRPELPNALYDSQSTGWGAEAVKRRPDITRELVEKFLTKMTLGHRAESAAR
jgi:hypothetical protein